MSVDPQVSQFNLASESQPPNLPLLVRSRQRRNSMMPKEVIIEVPTSRRNHNPQHPKSGIRDQIDACLDAICQQKAKILTQRQGKKDVSGYQSIHRIDDKLLTDYLKTVETQYRVRDRSRPFYQQHQTPVRAQSQDNRKVKRFLQLTQTSKVNKRPVSSFKTRQPQSTTPRYSSRFHQVSPQTGPTKISINSQQDHSHKKVNAPLSLIKISGQQSLKGVRYCINCQRVIPANEVDHHERYECEGFDRLYQMSFAELKELVKEKIGKIAGELSRKIEWLEEKQQEGGEKKYSRVTCETIERIRQYLKDLMPEGIKKEETYTNFKQSLNNPYTEAIELTQKLHWFSQVHSQLAQQVLKKQQKASNMSPKHQKPPPSPISQLNSQLEQQNQNYPEPKVFEIKQEESKEVREDESKEVKESKEIKEKV